MILCRQGRRETSRSQEKGVEPGPSSTSIGLDLAGRPPMARWIKMKPENIRIVVFIRVCLPWFNRAVAHRQTAILF